MAVHGVALSVVHGRCVHVAMVSAFATGVAWTALHYGINPAMGLEDGWRVAENWSLKLHGASAMAVLVVVGSMLAVHVPAAWRRNLNRRSGTAMLAASSLLAVTGWLLYYAAGESLRAWASAVHIAVGLAGPMVLLWHLTYRRALSRSRTPVSSPVPTTGRQPPAAR